MQTHITCPACNTPFSTEIHQIVDVGLSPELKEMLVSGYLNVAQCPACGAVTQVATPLLYHDPQHELFMVHVPMEMNLSHTEQQEQIGQLVKRAMDRLPAEQRRGYMLQPQTIMSIQTLIEKVLETEGITPEMLNKQRSQAELLQRLLSADKQQADQLIQDHDQEIDETFFAMLQALSDGSAGSENESQTLRLINLRARLYKQSTIGKLLERRQLAVHSLSSDAKREGLSQKLLLKHVLANRSDIDIVKSLVMVGQQAFDYRFFLLLSQKIEKREKAGVDVEQLIELRDELLAFQQQLESQSREALGQANKTLADLMAAEDKGAAVAEKVSQIDDLFMMVLSANIEQAEQTNNNSRKRKLLEVQEAIFNEIERQSPPEIRLVNRLVRAQTKEQQNRLLDENQPLVGPELLELITKIKTQAAEQENDSLLEALSTIQSLIATRIVT